MQLHKCQRHQYVILYKGHWPNLCVRLLIFLFFILLPTFFITQGSSPLCVFHLFCFRPYWPYPLRRVPSSKVWTKPLETNPRLSLPCPNHEQRPELQRRSILPVRYLQKQRLRRRPRLQGKRRLRPCWFLHPRLPPRY